MIVELADTVMRGPGKVIAICIPAECRKRIKHGFTPWRGLWWIPDPWGEIKDVRVNGALIGSVVHDGA